MQKSQLLTNKYPLPSQRTGPLAPPGNVLPPASTVLFRTGFGRGLEKLTELCSNGSVRPRTLLRRSPSSSGLTAAGSTARCYAPTAAWSETRNAIASKGRLPSARLSSSPALPAKCPRRLQVGRKSNQGSSFGATHCLRRQRRLDSC
jgi:hypothetical protein